MVSDCCTHEELIMPQVRKLTDDDVRTIERKTVGQRKATELEYDRYLADFAAGDYGEVTLEGDEKRLTIRNRLKAAAARHNPPLALDFRRTRGDVLRFQVKEAASAPPPAATPAPAPAAEEPSASAPAPAARKRGPRKAAAEAAPAPTASRGRKPRKTTGS
jgi:hypothetical protein